MSDDSGANESILGDFLTNTDDTNADSLIMNPLDIATNMLINSTPGGKDLLACAGAIAALSFALTKLPGMVANITAKNVKDTLKKVLKRNF